MVTVVQDDIRSLDPINSFADAVDNMIAINLLQEELLMMGQPYSDSDLIIQHSNKMPNTENFRALKMEFIDYDVSQFSTARSSLTHTQPNPNALRIPKSWNDYCHRIQRFNASDPSNQPKSALSARMHTGGSTTEVKALAAAEEPLEAMMRRIISEFKSQPTEPKRAYSQPERDSYKRGRQEAQGDRQQQQDRQRPQFSTNSRDQHRELKPHQGARQQPGQGRGQQAGQGRGQGMRGPQNIQRYQPRATQGADFLKFGKRSDSRRLRDEGRAYGASCHEQDADQDYDGQDSYTSSMAFSATQEPDDDGDDDDDDGRAMMGKRDYCFGNEDGDDEEVA